MEESDGPRFRATKRRKVVRKQHNHDDQSNDAGDISRQSLGSPSQDTETLTTPLNEKEPATSNLAPFRKLKKHGIGFTSSSPRTTIQNVEQSLVVHETKVPELFQQSNERFIKPTGKTVVTDDKHMYVPLLEKCGKWQETVLTTSAFIDSRLAKLNSAGANGTSVRSTNGAILDDENANLDENFPEGGISDAAASGPLSTTLGGCIAATNRRSANNKPPRRRRPRPGPSEADIARNSMIDQIMRESESTHYDQSTVKQAARPVRTDDDEDMDNDAAAAAAFKADFIAAAAERNFHRRMPVNPANGPKLGGSRSARERMKAMEDAQKGGTGKVTKP